jgi:rRNA maturation RNase YbeY
MSNLDIRNFTRSKPPVFPFAKALEQVLPDWEVSLVFAGEQRAQSLNIQLRNKDYVPNVLSYETGTSERARGKNRSGEIVICPAVAKKQAPSYGFSYPAMTGFLFIHGLLHLKGMRHGATMDKQERETLSQFTRLVPPDGTTHRDRH